jgi:hypothetical protein
MLTRFEISALRAYLREWIDSPAWDSPAMVADTRAQLQELRALATRIQSRRDIHEWRSSVTVTGMDPL